MDFWRRYYETPLYLFAITSFLSIAAGNITLGLATAFFLIYVCKNKIYINLESKGYLKVILFFLITLLLSALCSGDIARGIKIWADMRIWRMMPLMIIVLSIFDQEKAKKLLSLSILGFSIGCIYVIYQGINGNFRAPGFFGHPMTFGGWLCVYLPLLLTMVLDKAFVKNTKILAVLALTLGCIALIFNGTRGAWVAVFPVILLILGIYICKKQIIAFVCLLCILGAGIGLSQYHPFMQRVYTINDVRLQSDNERFLIWQSAYKMFKDYPVLGVGLGQYKDNYQKIYISPKAKEPQLSHAHNNFLQMLAENGLVGFIGFTIMIGYFIFYSLLNFYKTQSPYSLMLSMSTLTLVLQGLTEYNFGNSAVTKSYWFVIGCLLVLDSYYKKKE